MGLQITGADRVQGDVASQIIKKGAGIQTEGIGQRLFDLRLVAPEMCVIARDLSADLFAYTFVKTFEHIRQIFLLAGTVAICKYVFIQLGIEVKDRF